MVGPVATESPGEVTAFAPAQESYQYEAWNTTQNPLEVEAPAPAGRIIPTQTVYEMAERTLGKPTKGSKKTRSVDQVPIELEEKTVTTSDGDSLTIAAGTNRKTAEGHPVAAVPPTTTSSTRGSSARPQDHKGKFRVRTIVRDETSPYTMSSPLARMRDFSRQDSLESEPGSMVSSRKTHDEMKAEKQRKWKSKMRMAQERKLQERLALDGQLGTGILQNSSLLNVLQNNVMTLMAQCGVTDDNGSDSDYSTWGEPDDDDNSRGGTMSTCSDGSQGREQKRSSSSSLVLRKNSGSPSLEEDSTRKDTAGDLQRSNAPTRRKNGPEVSFATPLQSQESPNSTRLPTTPEAARSAVSTDTTEARMLALSPGSNLGVPRLPAAHPSKGNLEEVMSSTDMDPRSAEFVKAFVRDMTHKGFQLLWHKVKDSMHPATVTVRLRPGYRTPSSSYCGPRLAWEDGELERYGCNLFDIRSLQRAIPADLGDYPFAMPGRSVCLRMSRGRDFVFEAKTDQDAFRFVHGMRWVLARFSFNLVIGNMDVACELLDVGLKDSPGTQVHYSLLEEARRAAAMDDLTDQLVERSVYNRQVLS